MADPHITREDLRAGLGDVKELITSKFEAVNQRFDGIDAQLDLVNGRLNTHDHTLSTVKPLVDRHDERLTTLFSDRDRDRQARWSTVHMLVALLSGLLVAGFTFWLSGGPR